jgi:dTMP kinase
MSGLFITLEGGEGCGKSTQLALLSQALALAGIGHITTREPGGSPGAEAIRELVVNGERDRWDAQTETLLFYAARLDHVNRLIRPALARGEHVLCDRFADSTRVYQGAGKGVAAAFIEQLHQLTLDSFAPSLTLILDLPPEQGLARAQARGGAARFEAMGLSFHQKVREEFLAIAAREPQRCYVVDAGGEPQTIHRAIAQRVGALLGVAL